MRRSIAKFVTLVSFLSLAPFSIAEAALQRVGPVNPTFGYPTWYQDASGLTMDFCTPTNAAELSGGWCLILPPVPPATLPVAPEVFPNQFFNEHFYWNATAGGRSTGAILTIGVEAAFAAGPVIPGDQITFGRIRVVVPSLPINGDYTVYHPFGVWRFTGLRAGTRLFYTEDVGFNCAKGQFDCALATSIGPFLLPSAIPGGAELPPIPLLTAGQDPAYDALVTKTPYPGNAATATPKYIADPARIGPITGSPLAPFVSPADGLTYNHNRFRIEVTDTVGHTSVLDDNDAFSVQGRIFEGAIPGVVTVDRASYTAPLGGAPKLDVFATATAGMQARVPPAATATLLTSIPTLQFWDNPCAVDPVTLLPIGPPVPATPPHQIFLDATRNRYWGQSPPPAIPPSVCVAQTNAPAAGGGTTTIYFAKNVEDEVTVTQGLYDPTATALSVNAASSDLVLPPTLNLVDFGPFVNGVYSGTLLPPPATLNVVSSAGGVTAYQTNTTLGVAAASTVPIAVNDSATMFEDCSATASTVPCAAPLVVNALANDTVGGVPIVFGPGVTVTILSAPRFGTASVDPTTGAFLYTPNLNANGVDSFSYTVTVLDPAGVAQRSNVAGVTITITPVNDTPVAIADTASALVNKALAINVLANDTDPDFPADTLAIASVTQPVGPAGAIASAAIGGVGATAVNFTANLAGTYTFTYVAQDLAGALSNAATVTVTVAGAETLTITPPVQYIVASARWRLSGTDLPAAGQTLTVQYLDGPNKGFPIVSGFPVDALGNWVIDIRGATGILNPTTAGATQVIVFSSTGGVATAPITLK